MQKTYRYDKKTAENVKELREKAEQILRQYPEEWGDTEIRELQELLHELNVHRIELEMQNEELRTAHEEKERLKESYRLLFFSAPVGYLMLSEKGKMLLINNTFSEMLGKVPPEIRNRYFAEFIHPEDRDIFLRRFQAFFRNPDDKQMEIRIVRKDGTYFYASLEGRKFSGTAHSFPECGEEDSLLITVSNVNTLYEFRQQLEKEVRIRTEELSAAYEKLAGASRMKDEFLAMMSHELRTPLHAILGFTESLEEGIYGPIREEQANPLSVIRSSANHLLELISDILDLSRIEAGKVELEPEQVNVEDLARSVITFIRSMAGKKKQTVSLRVDTTGYIRADARRLKQILINLLGNAVKFTPENGVIGLDVTADSSRKTMEFTVWDTGIGIPEEQLHLLGKPFVQLHTGLGREYGGTGLGLSLVSKLTEMHGGHMTVESTPGKGSSFKITLPRDPMLST